MLAIVCPGQGAQTPGFLSPWLELPSVARRLDELSEAAGLDLLTHGTVSDAATIKDTAVAQPLIVAASLLTAHALFDSPQQDGSQQDGARVDGGVPAGAVLAGHSVGEIPAAALAGVLSEADAMRFVRERATGMATAAAAAQTGMSAVVGGNLEEVLAAIEAAGLTAANMNSTGQTVAAGTMEQLKSLAENPPAKARVIPLPVAGAFHTHHMSPAVAALETLRPRLTANDPTLTLLSNFDGRPAADGDAVMTSLIAQVSRPVRWDLCMETMLAMGVTALIELSPAGTLTGLAKRAMPNVATVALKTPADLDSARELIARTRDSAAGPSGQEEGHQ